VPNVKAILRSLVRLGTVLFFFSCSIQPQIPSVADYEVESMLRSEAARMLTASENSENSSKYLFFLSEFPRRRIELSGLIAGPWLLAIGRASSSVCHIGLRSNIRNCDISIYNYALAPELQEQEFDSHLMTC
jgi:hypothetical protein